MFKNMSTINQIFTVDSILISRWTFIQHALTHPILLFYDVLCIFMSSSWHRVTWSQLDDHLGIIQSNIQSLPLPLPGAWLLEIVPVMQCSNMFPFPIIPVPLKDRGTQVAKQMVMQLGMSPEIGQRMLGGQQGGGPFMGRDFMGQGAPPMSQALKQKVDDEAWPKTQCTDQDDPKRNC